MSRAPSGLGVYLLLIFQLLLLYQHPVRGQNIGAPVEGETVYVRVDAFLEEPHACIFRKNCASVPEERSAIPLQTEQSSAG